MCYCGKESEVGDGMSEVCDGERYLSISQTSDMPSPACDSSPREHSSYGRSGLNSSKVEKDNNVIKNISEAFHITLFYPDRLPS